MAERRRLTTILGHLKASASLSAASTTSQRLPDSGQRACQFTKYESAEILTPEQRAFYEENGFLVVKGLVSQENLDKYRERFKQVCTKEAMVDGMTVMKDVSAMRMEFGEKAVYKIQDFQLDPVLSSTAVCRRCCTMWSVSLVPTSWPCTPCSSTNLQTLAPRPLDTPCTKICTTFPFVLPTKLCAVGQPWSVCIDRMAAWWWCQALIPSLSYLTAILIGREV